jgi:hypothetical protein
MAVIATIKVPRPKVRGVMPPPGKVFRDRKKEAARRACRNAVRI